MKTLDGIEAIVMHPAVSRCGAPLADGDPRLPVWRTPGLLKLLALRRARRDTKRAARNLREEALAGMTYEQGGLASAPSMPGSRLLREALDAGGLPDDLRELVESFLRSDAARDLGRRGGLAGAGVSSPAKARASRRNGKLGGRPRKT